MLKIIEKLLIKYQQNGAAHPEAKMSPEQEAKELQLIY